MAGIISVRPLLVSLKSQSSLRLQFMSYCLFCKVACWDIFVKKSHRILIGSPTVRAVQNLTPSIRVHGLANIGQNEGNHLCVSVQLEIFFHTPRLPTRSQLTPPPAPPPLPNTVGIAPTAGGEVLKPDTCAASTT